uniref:Uncharacterized protein n=1 Tax=Tetranychus urticae TaxID=32264 RepID=T1JYY8_TETUR
MGFPDIISALTLVRVFVMMVMRTNFILQLDSCMLILVMKRFEPVLIILPRL